MSRKSVRFGTLLPIPTTPVEKLLNIARVNEEAGFNSIWAPDHLLFVPTGTVPEGWTILTAAAMVTKGALLGTCVTDPHRQHPAVLAQRLATLDQLSGGRVILGLGAGEAMNLEPFGIKRNKPVSKLVEAVTIMRRLWTGETVDYEGEFWKLNDAFLQVKPVRPTVPVYFGANSPRMLALTGKMADGWLPTPLNPELYKKRLKLIEDAARIAGRSTDEIDTGLYTYTSITERAEDAYKQLDSMKYMIVPAPELLKEAGYDVELSEELSSLSYTDLLPTGEWIDKFSRYGEFIPTEAAVDFSIAGTTQQCIDKIEEFVKAGVRHFILINMGPNPRQVMEIYSKEILPRFAE
jgi:alkanesulfonate monooxygenase SsuD/methylene tetrahydromethanopterin reductase-like flavin-dependent oxidoreductase (luciferase family)